MRKARWGAGEHDFLDVFTAIEGTFEDRVIAGDDDGIDRIRHGCSVEEVLYAFVPTIAKADKWDAQGFKSEWYVVEVVAGDAVFGDACNAVWEYEFLKSVAIVESVCLNGR